MTIIEDFICIILLLLIPDFILEKTWLLRSIDIIAAERKDDEQTRSNTPS